MLNRGLVATLLLSAGLGLAPTATVAQPAPTHAQASSQTEIEELEKFMDVYERVKAKYVKSVDDHTLIKGAIDGMLSALDPHSSYAEGADFDELQTLSDGDYGGLGLSVGMEDGTIKVITPTEDTPAWKAGIKAGDYI